MLTQAIILAGGMGSRLRSVVSDVPKPMALVNGKPFLAWLLDYLETQGICNVVLSVGYKWELIYEYFKNSYKDIIISYHVENEQLGTGGAIFQVMEKHDIDSSWVFNGDSIFKTPLQPAFEFFKQKNVEFLMLLKEMHDFDRYGVVDIDVKNRVVAFQEKKRQAHGWINAGVYIVQKKTFDVAKFPHNFSLEKDLLEKNLSQISLYGFPAKGYFIDIGIPEDYALAQNAFGD